MRAKVYLKPDPSAGISIGDFDSFEADEVTADLMFKPDSPHWVIEEVGEGLVWTTTYYPAGRVLKVRVETINEEDDQ